ncbi:MAG: aromatic ring-hydroxylating oxygenase subunit alpha, partial [Aestuariivirgaceae bacterium]
MNIPVLRLNKGDAPFCKDPASSYTLPARFYHDAAIHELEKDAIFARNWWYAGHKSQLAEPGSYMTTRIQDQSVFVGRSETGELKAFFNVCQHRGHELLQGAGRTNIIVCPYHAWSYDFDGNLRAARNSENMSGFNKCDFSLKPVRVEELCGLIFVNLDTDAVPLKEQAGGLEGEIRKFAPNVDDVVLAQRDEYDVAANWKVLIDN